MESIDGKANRSHKYLMLSICNSCRSMMCTCSKILFMFHTLTERSMDDVIAQFQLPIVSASSWMIRPKCASSTFNSCRVCRHQTYKFFLHLESIDKTHSFNAHFILLQCTYCIFTGHQPQHSPFSN